MTTRARLTLIPFLSLAALVARGGLALGAPPELVIAHQNLAGAGEYLDQNLDGFLRRIEEVAGWPKKSLRGKAFTRPAEALAYIKKQRSAFAILPAHQFLDGRKALKLEILGRAVGTDGTKLAYWTVTRRPKPFATLAEARGARLATTEPLDPAWLALMFEGSVDPKTLQPVEVASTEAAVQAVVDKKADLALVPEADWKSTYEKRAQPGGELEWMFTSGNTPPSAFLAVGKHVSAADKKKMAEALDKICKTTGADACARVGIMYIEAGRTDTYESIIEVYDRMRAALGPRR